MVVLSACCAVSLPSRANCTVGNPFRAFPVAFPSRPVPRWRFCGAYVSKEEEEPHEGRCPVPRAAILASDMGVEKEVAGGQSFLDVRSEEELLSCIRKEFEAGNISSHIAFGMKELYHTYKKAVLQSRNPLAEDIILSNMAITLDRILSDAKDPFTFSPYHKAVREPFDYFAFGQNYFRPLIDFRSSYVGNIHIFSEIEENLKKGHNVVLISNHQTEADPYIIALLLEMTTPRIAEETTYIAGDRVVTDPLCKPFSMGRNLICVHSKKHLYDFPELAEMKKKANTRSLKELALLFRTAGQIVWIAPSGGRDRPDPETGEWYPAPFDVSAVDNIRRLVDHSSVPGHIYPLALLCYDIMPPPPLVEKQIGERRIISFHGVGLSIGPEVEFDKIRAGNEDLEKAKKDFSQVLYDSVTEQYSVLKNAIYKCQGRNASISAISLSQPWNEYTSCCSTQGLL